MEQQLVVFDLAGESYGINIAAVESIIKMQPITQLPQSVAYICGVINLRGAVLPVIDLRIRFDLEPCEPTRHTRIIVVSINNLKMGIVVDAVSEVLQIQDENIDALPPTVASANSGFLKNIVRIEERLITLLELNRVLNIDEQQQLAGLR